MPPLLQLETTLPATLPFDEMSLVRAFATFTAAASSLERSYGHLQSEVARLRQELAESHRDLAHSLEDNQRMRSHLKQILQGLPCGVLVRDDSGVISMVNPEARRLLQALSTSGLDDLQSVPSWLEPILAAAAASGEECEHPCHDETLEWIALRHARLDRAGGGNSIFILRDISAAKRLQLARESLRRRQVLAEMSALLAHEVRNPLASLELFAGLLVRSALAEAPAQWAEQLQAGLRTLAATVNNILQFHGDPPSHLTPLPLANFLDSLEEFLRPLAQQAGVTLRLEHQLEDTVIAADEHRLEQAMLNLGLNAFRHMPQGGMLRIGGAVHPGAVRPGTGKRWARVEFSDSGPGIAPEQLALIFEPGFSTRPGSPGLGLAVCQTIMRQHGGNITVRSSPGAGASFCLEFPVWEKRS